MSLLRTALESLPIVATSGYALTAYVLTLAAYVVLGWRVARNKNLLANLEKVPEADRLRVLQMEMDTVVPKNISAANWIKARTHRYYFQAFIVTCIAVVAIIALVLLNATGTLDVSANVYSGKSLISDDRESSIDAALSPTKFDATVGNQLYVQYQYLRDGSAMRIEPSAAYLTKLGRGEYVSGINFIYSAFEWDFPILSIKVQNNSDQVVLLSEIVLDVKASKINTDPVLVVRSPGYSGIADIFNEGWGKAIRPQLQFALELPDRCGEAIPTVLPYTLGMETIETSAEFDIRRFVPASLKADLVNCGSRLEPLCLDGGDVCADPETDGITCLDVDRQSAYCNHPSKPPPSNVVAGLRRQFVEIGNEYLGEDNPGLEMLESSEAVRLGDEQLTTFVSDIRQYKASGRIPQPRFRRVCDPTPACVTGVLRYDTEAGQSKQFRFTTLVSLEQPPTGAPGPPTFQYDLFLESGMSGYQKRQAISQQIKPGETDHFLVRIGSDKSAQYDLDVAIADASGKSVWNSKISLDMFVPRLSGRNSVRSTTLLAAEPSGP
ncbi:MAG: hypothetical protein A3E01_15535 [Gammaproteobacteria bacterium RIFCSPHIGHO2_12_FULL_63_22]|nr:MAG: hypothetical protein A3E01_15535 [Gammaproteobacteria bacterium RIFCSPHIGHO2_12_FULL_63_22]